MPATLADLTLKLSQEISRLDSQCALRIEDTVRERDRLLSAGEAGEILARYHKGLDKAKQSQIQAMQDADETRDREIEAAEEKRRREITREEMVYGEARRKAFFRKNEASRKAMARWKEAVEKTKQQPLSEQRRLRQAADDALERALEEARETYNLAIEEGRLSHQAAVQDHIVAERLAVEAANRKAQRLITAAAIAYERAVASEETALRNNLSAFPEARSAQEEHDRRIAEIRRSCEEAKEALFEKFTRERRATRR